MDVIFYLCSIDLKGDDFLESLKLTLKELTQKYFNDLIGPIRH